MPVHSILNPKKSLCVALLLLSHNAAFGQPTRGRLPRGDLSPLEYSNKLKAIEKAELLSEVKGNDAKKRLQALNLLSRQSSPLSDDEALALYTGLLRVELPIFASPAEIIALDDFNVKLIDKLGYFGVKARPALPKLLALVNSREHSIECRFMARAVLGSIAPRDPAVVQCYFDQLKSENPLDQLSLVMEMEKLADDGFDVSEVLPHIRKLVNGEGRNLARTAFYALGRIRQTRLKKPERNLNRLVSNLKQFKTGSFDQAAYTLLSIQELKTTAKATQPLLRDLFQTESNDAIKSALLGTLGSTGLGNDLALTRLVLNAAATGAQQETAAAVLSYGIRKSDTDSIAFLVAALQPERHPQLFNASEQQTLATSHVQLAIIRGLTDLRESAGAAALPVAEILRSEVQRKSSNQTLMGASLSLLFATGPAGSASAPVVLDMLQPQTPPLSFVDDSNEGQKNRHALLKLASGLTITDEKLQRKALDIAIDGLKQENATIYVESARLAGSLGSQASDAIPYLLPALATDFKDTPLRQPYVSKTNSYQKGSDFFEKAEYRGSDSQAVIKGDTLFKARTSPRLEAMRTIGKIGLPAAAPALPLLEEWTKETAPPLYRLIAGDTLKVLRGEQASGSTLD